MTQGYTGLPIKAQDQDGAFQYLQINSDNELYTSNPTIISVANSYTSSLSASQHFSGSWEDVSKYASISMFSNMDATSSLYAQFSLDGTQVDRTLILSNGSSSYHGIHNLIPITKYFRTVLANQSTPITSSRLQVLYNSNARIAHPSSRIADQVGDYSDVLNTRATLIGRTDGGVYTPIPVTPEGHLEVAIHDPTLPFGSLHTENLSPEFQADAVYKLNSDIVSYGATLSGQTYVSESYFVTQTGTTIYSQAYLQSRKRLRYRPGQGVVARYTTIFSDPVPNSYQVIGVGHSEDGVYVGYKNEQFGILYSRHGERTKKVFTVNTAGTTGNATVTLNGVAYSVPITGSSNANKTAWELAKYNYSGWAAQASGSKVIYVSSAASAKNGNYSVTGATVSGSFTTLHAGRAATETFVSQSQFNVDTLDGNGPSGYNIDPTKGAVFQINIEYLGHGAIKFLTETTANGNNPSFTSFHSINNPNTLTKPSFGNPSFPYSQAVYSAGSTTNLVAKCASFAGFTEGKKELQGSRLSYYRTLTTVNNTQYWALYTVYNGVIYSSKANQSVINILDLYFAQKDNQPTEIILVKNGTLVGNPNFVPFSSTSCAFWDQASTSVSWTNNNQVLWRGVLAASDNAEKIFDQDQLTIQPGEYVTVAAKGFVAQSADYVSVVLNTREDQ